jgi:hypothetical protein
VARPRRSSVVKQIRAVRRSAREIDRALAKLAAVVQHVERVAARKVSAGARAAGPRRLKLTPKRIATLKLQGAYMGYMRQLGPRQKSRVKLVKEKKGFPAAIALAKRIAAK